MKTIILERPGRFTASETPAPTRPQPGNALVKVRSVGICGTDLHAYRGRQPFFTYPRILGHELGVEIVEAEENARGIRVGDRAAVEPYLDCGECAACRMGKPNCCERLCVMGVHVDGGMRELIEVPIRKLHRSDALSCDQLALVETLCIGRHAAARGRPAEGEWTLVVGAGPIGLSVMTAAKLEGARLIAADLNADRLRFCREALGVEHTICAAEEDLPQRLLEIADGALPSLVMDATGSPASMEASFAYASSGGRLVLVGLAQARVSFDDPEFHRKELTLMSSRNAAPSDFAAVIQQMERGLIDAGAWINRRASADEMIEAFDDWTDPSSGAVKAVVSF